MAHEGLRPSGWGKGEFPVKTWPPLNLLLLVLGNLDSCKQEGECGWETSTEYHCTPTKVFLKVFTVVEASRLLQLWLTPFNWLKGQSTDWLKITEPNLEQKGAAASASWWGPPGRVSVTL